MNELIQINERINLSASGDLSKMPYNDFLFNKSFLQYNNNYIKNGIELNKRNIFSALNKVPFIQKIISNFDKTKKYQVVFPKGVLEKLESHDFEWIKSREGDGLLTALIKEKGKNGIKHQIKLKEVFATEQLNSILSSVQMLTIQNSIDNISARLESLDNKLNDVLAGARNDRIAWIQSGYNLFLQAKASDKLSDSLYPIAIGQLNIGREQLIYSLINDLNSIAVYKTGFGAFTQQLSSGKNILEMQEEKINQIKQALGFIIRSTQLLSIIYQDYDEKWSLVQSVLRLNNVLGKFEPEIFEKLRAWDISDNLNLMEEDIKQLKLSIKENVNSLVESPKDVAIIY
jgi:archaellum component FlaC